MFIVCTYTCTLWGLKVLSKMLFVLLPLSFIARAICVLVPCPGGFFLGCSISVKKTQVGGIFVKLAP